MVDDILAMFVLSFSGFLGFTGMAPKSFTWFVAGAAPSVLVVTIASGATATWPSPAYHLGVALAFAALLFTAYGAGRVLSR